MVLEAQNICKNYLGQKVIENINISVKTGELVSLLGLSGIGKTTLFNILSGLDDADDGVVMLDGNNVTGIPGKVGYMQQEDLLMPFKTVIDNVSVPLTLKGVDKREARKKCIPLFKDFGIEGCEKKYPHQLSGGMRQRAAFLRTYLFGSDIMLLDEPFSALDAFTKRTMHSWFLNLMRRKNCGCIFITHDIDEAIFLSDKIYIMSGIPGKITSQFDGIKTKRTENFDTTSEFITLKKAILETFDNKGV